ncbi:PAS domain-containing sensor histidine kinase [Thermopolyspora sp. NPDC052614]|uniref:PAS domain-containing sensor histidine kinase n=1 Tax=Thermopolyspora sp. NPDC052614 TaxID=3155682 RepID=UPI00343A5A8A
MKTKVDFEAVFNCLAAPFAILSPDLLIMEVNEAYLRATGRTREEVIGRPVFDSFPANPDAGGDPDAPGVGALRLSLERVLSTGEADTMPLVRGRVVRRDRADDREERYWNLVNTPILTPDGKVRYIVHRSEDVTLFVRHVLGSRDGDTDLSGIRLEEMQNTVSARTRELIELSDRLKHAYRQEQQTVSALQEAIEHQQRFLFDASHDLRNPITGLLTELEVALSEPEADLPRTLRKLHRDVQRLNDIVGDLLTLARLYAGTPPASERVDLADLVEQELEAHPPSGNVITRYERPAVVRASRVRLARLLSNLLANAERHTTNKIEIVVSADASEAILEVIDDGPGIPPADRERIFHRLYRQEAAKGLDPGGSGFGLPIAREIAQGYGGHLYAADHPTGARFVLRLPLAA